MTDEITEHTEGESLPQGIPAKRALVIPPSDKFTLVVQMFDGRFLSFSCDPDNVKFTPRRRSKNND
jgi:hypothetical protein